MVSARWAAAFVSAFQVFSSVQVAAAAKEGAVLELTTKSFEKTLKENEFVFVEFYAPWCGHCKKLEPEWQKTAEAAVGVCPIGKVDAIQEKQLATDLGVQSFPTLMLFMGHPKVHVKYNGPRTPDKFVDWVKVWKSADVVQQVAASNAETWAGQKTITLLGFKGGDEAEDEAMVKMLKNVGFTLNPQAAGKEVPVGVTDADSAELKKLGLEAHSGAFVVMFRDFDFEDKQVVFSPPTNWQKLGFEAFNKWIQESRVAALIPGSAETEQFFLQDIQTGHGLVMYFGEDKQITRGLNELAVEYASETRMKWVHNKPGEFAEGIGKSVGLSKDDFPEFVIWEFGETEDDDKVFRYSQQSTGGELSKETAKAMFENWKKKKLSSEKDPVLSLTTDNFEKYVIDNERDVLVEFYAPWCGHCKSLTPVYKQLAKHYEKDEDIRIAKVDATKHKHSSAEVKSYPTIKFYKKGEKNAPMDAVFKANRDLKSLTDFIEENRASAKGGKKKKAKKEKSQPEADGEKQEAKKETKQQNTATPQGDPVASAGGAAGVWAFDDSHDATSRGKFLSGEMLASQGGYTLVQIGDLGILLAPGSPPTSRAVRRFAGQKEAQTYFKAKGSNVAQADAKAAPADDDTQGAACPQDADAPACQAWCEIISPGDHLKFSGTLSGKQCKDLGPKPAPNDKPQCMCYDEGYKLLYAQCLSLCPAAKSAQSREEL